MHTVRCVLAEWQLVRVRLVRTRLGLWLLLLGGALVGLGVPAAGVALETHAVLAGALAAVLTVAFGAGSAPDRAALSLALSHPTTPGAIACGRWVAVTAVAAGFALICVTGIAWAASASGPAPPSFSWGAAAAAGIGAGAATAACALPAAYLGGNAVATALFLHLGLLSSVSPAELCGILGPGPLRAIGSALLQVAPSVWRYQRLATGDPAAWLHAALWMCGGVLATSAIVARRRP